MTLLLLLLLLPSRGTGDSRSVQPHQPAARRDRAAGDTKDQEAQPPSPRNKKGREAPVKLRVSLGEPHDGCHGSWSLAFLLNSAF